MRGLLCGLFVLACAGSAVQAARPDLASDCALFAIFETGRPDGALACSRAGQPPRIAIRDRRAVDPATILKQGLIW